MRVITGTARGRKLREPSGHSIRPTSDMVKEALFSIIQFDIEGRRVLDLFAGTGQLGIEALSRGASHVTFVDEKTESVKLISENLKICGMKRDRHSEDFGLRGAKADYYREDFRTHGRSDDKHRENFRICRENVLSFLESCGKYDLIFIDPPYEGKLAAAALQKIIKFDILSDGGIIICETDSEFTAPPAMHPYFPGREYRYGKVKLTVFGRYPEGMGPA